MTAPLALAVAALLLALSAFHVTWALGVRRGAGAAIPTQVGDGTPLFHPGRVGTLAVAAALAAGAAIVLARAGVVAPLGPAWVVRAGAWALGGAFALRAVGDFRYVGAFKRVRGTAFARRDTRLYTPLCALIAASVLWIATR